MGRAFSSVSSATAELIQKRFQQLRSLGVPAISLIGGWRGRRFVIVDLERSTSVTEAVHDLEAGALTVPTDMDLPVIVSEARRFGARIEHRYRSENRGFEVDVSMGDGRAHTVHRFHHVALCSHSGPWPESSEVPGETVAACLRCQIASVTKPGFRARYHPTAIEGLYPSDAK